MSNRLYPSTKLLQAQQRTRPICHHEEDDHEPGPVSSKPIVSINGEDVIGDQNDEIAARKPAA